MIDPDLVTAAGPTAEHVIRKALADLHSTGVIESQIQREKLRLLNGNSEAPLEQVVEEVLRVRRKVQTLQTFSHLCERFYKETYNA